MILKGMLLAVPWGMLMVGISGCAAYNQVLLNADGKIMTCDVFGVGIIGVITADSAYESCLASRHNAGFLEVEKVGATGFVIGENMTVISLVYGGPADIAGVTLGDKLEKIAGIPVTSKGDANTMLFGLKNTEIELTMLRNGQSMSFIIRRKSWAYVSQISENK